MLKPFVIHLSLQERGDVLTERRVRFDEAAAHRIYESLENSLLSWTSSHGEEQVTVQEARVQQHNALQTRFRETQPDRVTIGLDWITERNALLAALQGMLDAYAPKADETVKQSGEASLHSAVRAARAAIRNAEAIR